MCGCLLFPVPVIKTKFRKGITCLSRMMICYDFMRNRHWLFDRVLLTDFFDTVFQGDPFYKGLGRDFVGFSDLDIMGDSHLTFTNLDSHTLHSRRLFFTIFPESSILRTLAINFPKITQGHPPLIHYSLYSILTKTQLKSNVQYNKNTYTVSDFLETRLTNNKL
jgi:hypothetical protein